METAIILHGKPSKENYFDAKRDAQSNSHWLPWIQQQLLVSGILAQAPELPNPYKPVYEDWKEIFEKFEVTGNTILIGHSCGAGFLTRWLSEHNIKTGKVALVAPWLDPDHTLSTGFFDFEIDPGVPQKTEQTSIFISSDDDPDIQTSVQILKDKWPSVHLVELEGKGHFTFGDMGTKEFPELLAVLALN